MKKSFFSIGMMIILAGCGQTVIEKPIQETEGLWKYSDQIPKGWSYQKLMSTPFEMPVPDGSISTNHSMKKSLPEPEREQLRDELEIYFFEAPQSVTKVESFPDGLCYSENGDSHLAAPYNRQHTSSVHFVASNNYGLRVMRLEADCNLLPVYAIEYRGRVYAINVKDNGYIMQFDHLEAAVRNLRPSQG